MIPEYITSKITDIRFHTDRAKSQGYMYGGQARAIVNSVEYKLKLWHHGGDNETESSLRPHLMLEGVVLNPMIFDLSWDNKDTFFDAYWHVLMDENSCWLHLDGWFQDKELRAKIPSGNPNLQYRSMHELRMIELGFYRLY